MYVAKLAAFSWQTEPKWMSWTWPTTDGAAGFSRNGKRTCMTHHLDKCFVQSRTPNLSALHRTKLQRCPLTNPWSWYLFLPRKSFADKDTPCNHPLLQAEAGPTLDYSYFAWVNTQERLWLRCRSSSYTLPPYVASCRTLVRLVSTFST
jgi:hypothetical protein